MARIHLTYKKDHFPDPIRELTLRFVKQKPWLFKEPQHLFEVWLHGACLVYQLPTPILRKLPDNADRSQPTYGEYKKAECTEENPFGMVILRRWSIISLMHQFRHHLQENSDHEYASDEEGAQDAQEWACSLFYTVAPRRFRRMVRAGRVVGVHDKDLLKTNKKGKK